MLRGISREGAFEPDVSCALVQGKENGFREKLRVPTTKEASMPSFKGKEPNIPKVRHMEIRNRNHKVKDFSPSKQKF